MFKEHVAPAPDESKNRGDQFAKGQITMQQH
jgi:hypothetical protein